VDSVDLGALEVDSDGDTSLFLLFSPLFENDGGVEVKAREVMPITQLRV
jgi:hypothetical protein